MTAKWETYLKEHRGEHLEELKQFLTIPSISTDSAHKGDMVKAANWVADALRKAGIEHVAVMETGGNPVVYGDWLHVPGAPTALVYGHYDVQPVEPLEEWDTPPFEPAERDGKLYARGATDDKGQLFLHVKAVQAMLQTEGKLPVNLKFCIEGEEEISSPQLPAFIERHRDLLKADLVAISDSPMLGKGMPAIDYALRGLCGIQIDVRGNKTDLHSGMYGGGVPNAINALAVILGSLFGPDGKVAVTGFYDDVKPLSEEERKHLASLPFDEREVLRETGARKLAGGEAGYSYVERTTARPTLDLCGVSGGHAGEGVKPIIPAAARAKLTCRLVNDQKPDRIMDLLEKHVKEHAPDGVEVEVTRLVRGNPYAAPYDHAYFRAASDVYQEVYKQEPLFVRSGASIPIVETFSRLLGTIIVPLAFGLPDEHLHAPNEHFNLENFDLGMRTICRFWEKLGTA